MRFQVAWLICFAPVWMSCSQRAVDKTDGGAPSRAAADPKVWVAEYVRDPTAFGASDLASRSVEHRRRVVRALARIEDPRSHDLLAHALHDEDPEVIAFAAMGLGQTCRGSSAKEVSLALVSRAGTLYLDLKPASAKSYDPFFALASALGRCATDEAEAALRSWLTVGPELAGDAALGLSLLSQNRRRLSTQTLVALLDAVDRFHGFAIGVLPFAGLEEIPSATAERLLALAPKVLDSSGESRRFVIRALGRGGPKGLPLLSRIIKNESEYRPGERVEALRVLGQLGDPGQEALGELLPRVMRADKAPNEAWMLSAEFGVVLELLEQLKHLEPKHRAYLVDILEAIQAPSKASPIALRVDRLRCKVAALAALEDSQSKLLDSCATTEGSQAQKLARLSVLVRQRLRGRGLGHFESWLEDADPIVRIEALKALPTHDEVKHRAERLAFALEDKSAGVVATAAGLVAAHPELSLQGERPHPEVVETLERVVKGPLPADAIELRASLIDAIGAIGVLSAKTYVNEACGSVTPRLRERAEDALHRLGEPRRSCAVPTQKLTPPKTMPQSVAEVTLVFQTDLQPLSLRLYPKLAPFAVDRLVTLAKAGFFDSMVVHRVVPGFVVQLGDKSGDGYGIAQMSPLPCELAPMPFEPGDVGMALSGRDTASSQFFVTLGPYPQLASEYTKVGRAGSGWDRLTSGDVIKKVELSQ